MTHAAGPRGGSSPGDGDRPQPAVAYARWLDALSRAGWRSRRAGGAGPEQAGTEQVAVAEALGRVTGGPVTARRPSPRSDCAAMDGIAAAAADLARAVSAHGALRLPAGSFALIDTGDPMPAGADTVVVRERLLHQADGSMLITPDARGRDDEPGRNVRGAGEDFVAGEVLVPAGRRLRPGELAAAAAGGHVTLVVRREPTVAIIPTGDEIRPVGSKLRRGEIMDTNSLMLAARCRQLGAAPLVAPVVPDDPDALAAELRHAAARADLVLVIAGSSRGRDDHTGAVLAQVGGVAVSGVAVRPGHPALLGHAKRPGGPDGRSPDHSDGVAPVIGLPGYPLATAVTFELFAAPLLGELTGIAPAGQAARARLDRDWTAHPDHEDWVLVTLAPAGADVLAVATPTRRGASSISQLARADAWWRVPAGSGQFAAGTDIEVILIP